MNFFLKKLEYDYLQNYSNIPPISILVIRSIYLIAISFVSTLPVQRIRLTSIKPTARMSSTLKTEIFAKLKAVHLTECTRYSESYIIK